MAQSQMKEIRDRCLAQGVLWEDPEFPAINRSVYYSKVDRNLAWKRPFELFKDPKFVVGSKSRFDLNQGSIGNCWYIAGVATVATRPELFNRIVPADQSFSNNYAGIFHFYFWRFGRWVEVLVDDRLPTYRGHQLIFCHNRDEKNEFWAPLIEKAYAKLHGSYEALEGGWTEDALVDFTGGIGRRIDLKDKEKIYQRASSLFKSMNRDALWNSLQGCSIEATADTMENELSNGLVIGHAYSITMVTQIRDNRNQSHRLVRLRNPWGRKEWRGDWSDKSRMWQQVDESVRNKLRLNDEDGEFWMSFEDWLQNFDTSEVCYLPPSNIVRDRKVWKETSYHGEWVKGVSAGGCGNPPNRDLYWTNPQFALTIKDPDEEDDERKCTLIVSLMQKDSRRMRSVMRVENANVAMAFDIYKLKTSHSGLLDSESYSRRALQLARSGERYQYYREITSESRLEPGTYVIIPSTFEAFQNRNFLLRYYTQHDAESSEVDLPTEPIAKPPSSTETMEALFVRHSGSDRVVDSRELSRFLNDGFRQELGQEHEFELEACRSLLAMFDTNRSGVLEWAEVRKMWAELTTWRQVFVQFDKDNSGFIDVSELRKIFNSIEYVVKNVAWKSDVDATALFGCMWYSLSRRVLASLVRRYGGKEGRLAFNDFLMAVTKVVVHMNIIYERVAGKEGDGPEHDDIFSSHSKEGGLKGKAKFTLDEYMEVAMYF